MAVMTLPEYAKGQEDMTIRAIVELYPEAVDFLTVMPFMTAESGSFRYQEEGSLPDNVAFRAINEEPTAGAGLMLDKVEKTFPMAGNLDVDRRLIARQGIDRKSVEQAKHVKKHGSIFANTFLFGDNQSNHREFSGMKTRLAAVGGSVDGTNYESRLMANATVSGGGALSLSQLDRAIGLVESPNAILMPKAIKDRFPAAQRDTSIGGYIDVQPQEFGEEQVRYRGLQIYTGYGISKFGEFLPFNEVAHGGGGAVTSSIYVVRFSEDGVCGLQQQPMEVTPIGLTEGGVWDRTNVEWDCGMMIEDPYSAIRLSSITNAAIVK